MADHPVTRGSSEPASLLGALRVLRERWWIVLLGLVVGIAVLAGLALRETKQYEATASVVVQPSQVQTTLNPNVGSVDRERDQATALVLVTSTAVGDRVARALGGDRDTVLGAVDAVAEPDADLIQVTATDPDPARSAAIANAFAEQFVEYRRTEAKGQFSQGAEELRRQRDALPPTATEQRAAINTAISQILLQGAAANGNATVADRAGVPGEAASPRPRRDAILGALLGLAAGLALAFLVDLFDRRLKDVEDFESAYGFGALTAVPLRDTDPTTQRDRQVALEPYRILRNGLSLLDGVRDPRVVMVTSAVPAEGKSTVAAGLARAVALSGQSVVLVEADLRRPTFRAQFGLEDSRGLTTALVGGVPVSTVTKPVLPGLRSLTVLPSGPIPPNAAELLRSAEFSSILADLLQESDVVVLDAPPLLPVADSQVLLDNPHIDCCLLVGRAFKTTREDARRARAIVDRHRQRNVGLVVNGLRDVDASYDYYGAAEEPATSRA